MNTRLVLSCEHGGNDVPATYAAFFSDANAKQALETHRGWDPGALALFNKLAPLADFSLSSTISRLLVELNRSLHHPKLFSAYVQAMQKQQREAVLNHYYHPYRQKLQEVIGLYLQQGDAVCHLSIHSFTPVLDGVVREADIGLLYDPSRDLEKSCSQQWKRALKEQLPAFRIRFNYPYKGTADGFTTYLRKQFTANYAGIELELNQQWADQEIFYEKILNSVKQLKQSFT